MSNILERRRVEKSGHTQTHSKPHVIPHSLCFFHSLSIPCIPLSLSQTYKQTSKESVLVMVLHYETATVTVIQKQRIFLSSCCSLLLAKYSWKIFFLMKFSGQSPMMSITISSTFILNLSYLKPAFGSLFLILLWGDCQQIDYWCSSVRLFWWMKRSQNLGFERDEDVMVKTEPNQEFFHRWPYSSVLYVSTSTYILCSRAETVHKWQWFAVVFSAWLRFFIGRLKPQHHKYISLKCVV